MSAAGTVLALVGAYLPVGEPAAAGWDPEAGFPGYAGVPDSEAGVSETTPPRI
ncbi:hypothetical protein [Nocardia sp. BMG51109]|uniref:hypothetical protein n=1 Tax=Nocardia sp. BMG51109 TaxID=1056816 RepID=UPI0004BA411C|nr:hypothetical protein [Nocardia sp. BMG51109]